MTNNPILVEVVRGDDVESIHRGSICVVEAGGKVLRSWGDADALICPRSAIKPFQALPLIDSGAAAAFAVTDEDLALACASHSGEPEHVARVQAWLDRLQLSVSDLECGAHAPANNQANEALVRSGLAATALHNNCSGKHAAFLTVAKHFGVATRGYTAPTHPVQQAVLKSLSAMTGVATSRLRLVRDGCSAPNVFVPLRALALGWARLGARSTPAAERVVAAMKKFPLLVSGHGRPCAALIAALAGTGIVKTGAEGVYAAVLPDQGLGIAVKMDDGAGRAAVVALTAVLDGLKAFKPEAVGAVAALKEPVQTAWAGGVTGTIRPARSWVI